MIPKTENLGPRPKKYIAIVDDIEIAVENPKVTGLDILNEANIKNYKCVDLFHLQKPTGFEKISLDEVVDLSVSGVEKFITKDAEYVEYIVDNQPEITDKKYLTPEQILKLAGINPDHHFLILIKKDGSKISYAHKPNEKIKMVCENLHFISEKKDSICNIEECCSKGVIPIISYRYVIKINSQEFTVDEKEMTGRQILSLINQTPETYYLRYKHKNGSTIVKADDLVDFTACGVERFSAKAKNCTEGRVNKRDFVLPIEDSEYLGNLNLDWDTVKEASLWLIIRNYPIPSGYNVEVCDVAIVIPSGYPISPLDMFYMYPNLIRKDGLPIGALSPQIIENKQYQRWSRHRTASNQWIPGEDNLATHLELMNHSLLEEFTKR